MAKFLNIGNKVNAAAFDDALLGVSMGWKSLQSCNSNEIPNELRILLGAMSKLSSLGLIKHDDKRFEKRADYLDNAQRIVWQRGVASLTINHTVGIIQSLTHC